MPRHRDWNEMLERPSTANNPTLNVTAELTKAVRDRTALIGVIGLGYVGIPLALTAARAGFEVLGFDIDAARVEQINLGKSFIKHIPPETIAEVVNSDKFSATA